MSSDTQHDLSSALGFDVDINQVLRNMSSDFFDDWYFDCFNYEDLKKSPHAVKTALIEQISINNGQYPPKPRTLRNVPKKGLPVRYSLETDYYDRFIYQAICTFLMPFYDPTLSHRALSHRYSTTNKRYLFENRIERWLTFEGITYTYKKSRKYLLITDISNYYENITTEDIIDQLLELLPKIQANTAEKHQIRNAISLLEQCLAKWSYSDRFGLPQNRDPSSFLANVLLRKIDNDMTCLGYDYYRYVDDIRVICTSESQARKAIQDLIGLLRDRGLNVNSSKTKILGPESEPSEIDGEFPNKDARVVSIEQMWKSRDKKIIFKSIKYIVSLFKECLDTNQTQSRLFRFATNRLAQLAELGLLQDQTFTSAVATNLLENLYNQPASTDQYTKLLNVIELSPENLKSIEQFLADREKAIHDWQNYHLWILLAKKKTKSTNLLKIGKRVIQESSKSAEAAAIIVWSDQVRYKSIANLYLKHVDQTFPFQNQRYLAIATRNYDAHKMKKYYRNFDERISGTRTRIQALADDDNQIIFPRKEMAITDLIREVREYD